MSGEARPAVHRKTWWPGWIWAVPVAALAIVTWLVVRSQVEKGPEVTVIFPEVADLRAGDTNVTFEGLKVGQESGVRLEPDMRHLRTTLQLDADMAHRITTH